jgi:hypothetical protein
MATETGEDVFADIRARYFPMKNDSSGLIAEACADATHFNEVTSALYRRIFTHQPAYAVPAERRAAADRLRRVHDALHHERFLISDSDGAVVGWMCGEMDTCGPIRPGMPGARQRTDVPKPSPRHRRRGITIPTIRDEPACRWSLKPHAFSSASSGLTTSRRSTRSPPTPWSPATRHGDR